jgi:hypothetical protein
MSSDDGSGMSGRDGGPEEDARVVRWRGWIEHEIKNDVLTLFHYRAVYRRVGEIINNREPRLPPSVFLDVWQSSYVTTQAAGVRRQADRRRDVASLGRLLTEIAARPALLTRAAFLAPWDDDQRGRGDTSFTEHFGAGEFLDPLIATADANRIKHDSDTIVTFVHENIAHRAAAPVQTLPTYEELNSTIDMIGELFRKYHLLLTSDSYALLEPAIQGNWLAIFQVPWLVAP